MGKSSRRKAAVDLFDSSDDESVSSTSTALSDLNLADATANMPSKLTLADGAEHRWSKLPSKLTSAKGTEYVLVNGTEYINSLDFQLEQYIDALYEKRGSIRETALAGLVEAFEGNVLLSFVKNKCITLLHLYINSIKKGSTKESYLASRAIGLLAITVGAGNSAHEIMEESASQLSRVLISCSDALKKASLLDCLAVVTFIGANDLSETEISLRAMWQLIYPKSGPNVGAIRKPTSSLLAATISAWSFLLTTISAWSINPDNWKESLPFLCTLLDDNDRSVRMAAGEAIGVFFDMGLFDMAERGDEDNDTDDEKFLKYRVFMQSLKAKILDRAKYLSAEAGGKGIDKKNLNDQRVLFQNILDFVQTGNCPETTLKISKKHGTLKSSTWIEMIQFNFFKRFLGKGFLKHAQNNELLHEIFYFVQNNKRSPSAYDMKIDDKGRTQKLNKNRRLARERKSGYLMDEDC